MTLTTLFSETPPTMSSREIAELTGKRHDHVLSDIRKMLDELVLSSPDFSGEYKDSTGRTLPCFHLPQDLTITLVSGYNITMRHRIIKRWQELEKSATPIALPKTFAEALRLAAAQQEEIDRLAIERDDAIKTKAYISDKKTATAMGTASAAVRKANKLQDALDDVTDTLNVVISASKEYATVKTVGRYTGITYKYGPLVKYCRDHGLAIRKIPDEHYGHVNSYPAEAWQAVHGVDISTFY